MTLLKAFWAAGLMTALSGSAWALTATQSIQKEVTTLNADGTTVVSYEPADLVAPGERIVYALEVANDDTQAATNLVLTMPVPEEIKYVEGSAVKNGAIVTYSADNGQSFADRDTLIVLAENGVTRSANSEDITHIRWKITGSIEAGATDRLSFKGELK